VEALCRFGPLAGRILLGLIFILEGFGKITGFHSTVGYIDAHGLPMPQIAAIIAIVVELGGGIMIAIGWKARWAAAALFIFILVASVVFHAFWAVPPEQVRLHNIMFMKNIAIMGGMLYLMVHGSGPMSVDKKP